MTKSRMYSAAGRAASDNTGRPGVIQILAFARYHLPLLETWRRWQLGTKRSKTLTKQLHLSPFATPRRGQGERNRKPGAISWVIIAFTFLILIPGDAWAGGGPENLFLVVNAQDSDSLTIANYYIELRQIPSSNVFYLDWDVSQMQTDVTTFRERILMPIFDEIDRRKLKRQIDYVVYSAGFPYVIDYSSEVPETVKYAKASITGLTFLHEYLSEGSTLFQSLSSNRYMRNPNQEMALSTQGFRARYGFDLLGNRLETGGRHYVLSVMLGHTSGAKNTSLDEVLDYLRRSALADGTLPGGTFYFMRNSDIRSTTRHNDFEEVVNALRGLGLRAEIGEGVLPQNKPDVQGLVVGKALFDWAASRSEILPGAICENLTSFGGKLNGQTSHSLLTEFLRYGAAGSSGTVVEPYAIRQKFPHPRIHVHYAEGCSLAEAFYQSVRGPYQLLIVGDPLCRPWAAIPEVQVEGIAADQTVRGRVDIKPVARMPVGKSVRRFEIFVDGVLSTSCGYGEATYFDSVKLTEGYHELRVVAIEDSRIETQGRAVIPFFVANAKRRINCRPTPAAKVFPGQPLFLNSLSRGSSKIVVFQNRRRIASLQGVKGEIPIDVTKLGAGPVRLQAVGIAKSDGDKHVFSAPIYVEVMRPRSSPQIPTGR